MLDEQSIIQTQRFHERKGREEGLAEGKAESARAMLADNMDPQLIAKYTGLTAEEIAA